MPKLSTFLDHSLGPGNTDSNNKLHLTNSKCCLIYSVNRPNTFALWPSEESADHINVAHQDWTRCIPSVVLSGMLATATDRLFMASFLVEHPSITHYPVRFAESTRSSVYDDLLNLLSA